MYFFLKDILVYSSEQMYFPCASGCCHRVALLLKLLHQLSKLCNFCRKICPAPSLQSADYLKHNHNIYTECKIKRMLANAVHFRESKPLLFMILQTFQSFLATLIYLAVPCGGGPQRAISINLMSCPELQRLVNEMQSVFRGHIFIGIGWFIG